MSQHHADASCREAFGFLAAAESDDESAATSMDHRAIALALLGPNHRGNVTFETINDDASMEDSSSMKAASRNNSAEARDFARASSVKFAEPNEVNFKDWYDNTAPGAANGSGHGTGRKSGLDGTRTPELGSSLRYLLSHLLRELHCSAVIGCIVQSQMCAVIGRLQLCCAQSCQDKMQPIFGP